MPKKRSESNCLPHLKIKLEEKHIKSFWNKVEKLGENECWKWKAYKNKQGYGRFGFSASQSVNAHRISWVIHFGEIPPGLFVCHKCDNPECTNPQHLFLGTRQDNINDSLIKKRAKHFSKNKYYGVVYEERYDGPNKKGRWRSFICIKEKIIKLGAHTSLIEAARNYDRIAYIKYGEREKLNFPEDYTSD